MAVERQRGSELLNKRIDQLLLVVAQVTSGGQGTSKIPYWVWLSISRHLRVVPLVVSGGKPRGHR